MKDHTHSLLFGLHKSNRSTLYFHFDLGHHNQKLSRILVIMQTLLQDLNVNSGIWLPAPLGWLFVQPFVSLPRGLWRLQSRRSTYCGLEKGD